MINRIIAFLCSALLVVVTLTGCDSTVSNAYKSIKTAATLYDTAGQVLGDMYADGIIDDDGKATAIKCLAALKVSIQTAKVALVAYNSVLEAKAADTSGSTDDDTWEAKLDSAGVILTAALKSLASSSDDVTDIIENIKTTVE